MRENLDKDLTILDKLSIIVKNWQTDKYGQTAGRANQFSAALGWQLYCHPEFPGVFQEWQYNCHPNQRHIVKN